MDRFDIKDTKLPTIIRWPTRFLKVILSSESFFLIFY